MIFKTIICFAPWPGGRAREGYRNYTDNAARETEDEKQEGMRMEAMKDSGSQKDVVMVDDFTASAETVNYKDVETEGTVYDRTEIEVEEIMFLGSVGVWARTWRSSRTGRG